MIRSTMGTVAILVIAGTASAQNLFWPKPTQERQDVPIAIAPASSPDLQRFSDRQFYTKETAIDARIKRCVEQGGAIEACRCSAETAAEILDEDDFTEETWYLHSENLSGLRDFQNRMFAEQRDRMFQLGEALGDCPASLMRLE
jgi:hypothetical protein